MSRKGSLLRGEKWFALGQDGQGNLTKEMQKDTDKMIDINNYLEAKKKEEEADKEETKSKVKK